jgi:cobyrinic acid a,c-diamide synthase
LGYLPRDLNFEIPHRHLGLTVAEENPLSEENLDRLADTVLRFIDVEEILRQQAPGNGHEAKDKKPIAISPSPIAVVTHRLSPILPRRAISKGQRARIAVAYDKAFCFYYEDNLDLMRDGGLEVVKFSPLVDSGLPGGVDAVYIGGGYPELHAPQLSANKSMLTSIRTWADEGRPMYAECGGLMYLSQGIYDFEDAFFPMAGVFPFETVMKKGRSRLGYREIVLDEDCMLGGKGDRLRGHEFHYSEIKDSRQSAVGSQQSSIYSVRDGDGNEAGAEGYRVGNTLASYIHVHFGSNARLAKHMNRFVAGIAGATKNTEALRKRKI